MDNPENILHSLEEFSKVKPKEIPRELDDYLCYVAKTGDPVFKWSITKCLFREKLLKVITDFYESTLTIDLPPCPNVPPFDYERMKSSLIEKLETFHGAPFTVQRISELLTNPRKEYNRADKFMRAIEKNILVVSTREPGKYADTDSESIQDTSFNGIPEPSESAIDSSFSCNDLTADPDSSSPTYETVNSESQDNFNSKIDVNSPQFIVNNKSECGSDDRSSEESNSETAVSDNSSFNDEAVKGDQKADDESESVICSMSPIRSDGDTSENYCSNESRTESVSTQEEVDSKNVEMPCANDPVHEGEKETETSVTESVECSGLANEEITSAGESEMVPETVTDKLSSDERVFLDTEEPEKPLEEDSTETSTISSDNLVTDSQTVVPDNLTVINSPVHKEEPVSTEGPVTAECDTSISCDSDIEIKTGNKEFKVSQIEISVTSENEVSSCDVYAKDGRIIVNDYVPRETSVIHTTTCEPEPESEAMEVDECQISSAEGSECNLEDKNTVSSMEAVESHLESNDAS